MIKYEFMRAHGKGSEGSEKRGGGAKIKRGCEKKGGAPHPLFFKKGGARSTGTPPCVRPCPPLLSFTPVCTTNYLDIFKENNITRRGERVWRGAVNYLTAPLGINYLPPTYFRILPGGKANND